MTDDERRGKLSALQLEGFLRNCVVMMHDERYNYGVSVLGL